MILKLLRFFALGAIATGVLLLSSCKKEDEPLEDEQELITTVNLNFTELGTNNVRSFFFRDPDGPGGNAPTVFNTIMLQPSRQYNCSITILNESVNPVSDISAEIRSEADAHQFYFTPAPGSTITVNNLDTDGGGLPLGLNSRWTTGIAGTSTLTLTLKHKPGIKAAGDAITKGDTDVEIVFPTQVQ